MHAVVSLFDEHTTEAVKNLWTELATDFGVRQLAEVLPYAHFSYQIARHYDAARLTRLVEQLAHQATPFPIQAGGLALFTGPRPVLYVPIVRTIELSHFHQSVYNMNPLPLWLDSETRALIKDLIGLLAERHPDLLAVILYGSVARHEERPLGANSSDVDLLAVFDSDDPLLAVQRGDSLSHTLGLAYERHLDAPREVQVMFASRTLQEWDPTFIANVMRDGIVLYGRGPLPAPFAA